MPLCVQTLQPHRASQEVEAQIAESQQELARSKVCKQQQQEYEALKATIVELPPRATTEAEIAQVQGEIEDLRRESVQLDRDIEVCRFVIVCDISDTFLLPIHSFLCSRQAALLCRGPGLACSCCERAVAAH